ncbi:acetyl-CoA carboxylase biotin carboxylase subunit family protein [Vibrio parahaemolyticus]|uniref:ATP-grasp domain-containing protein n=1 Tax=Vibrio parahaemolyticus TaxID=670 RepID=UPI00211A5F8C|nr:hypothetical protein [Vibrio parahaemolyticus]EGR3402336.1 amino acid ligase [Vibrio parahaemolyticus]EJC6992861.1 hypothetical protein [Vibrio parahaemolyticus]EKN4615161.1 hypothetical protein [Vibrio parahaemolyticus]MCQ9041918.1 amino acid ligase [Vibrio parahaemolyticus]MCQ9054430.1 amino acid ligase [Vibrio parahaemolyticus]
MKRILYVYAMGGPPISHYYPIMSSLGEVLTILVATPSSFNHEIMANHSKSIADLTHLSTEQQLEKIKALAVANEVDVLFTFSEFALVDISNIARELGLKGVGKNVEKGRNKIMMRESWQKAGVPQPRFVPLHSIEEKENLKSLRPPFIIKLAYGAGSIAQQVIQDLNEVDDALDRMLSATHHAQNSNAYEIGGSVGFPALIAEELIDSTTESWYDDPRYGDFVSVEGLVKDGVYHPLAMTGRLKTVPPFTELGNLAPCVLSTEQKAKIVDETTNAINALELDDCVTHTELKLLKNNGMSFLETAVRMGGVGIACELKDVFDIDYVELFIKSLLGETVTIPMFEQNPPRCAAGSVAMIGCDSDGKAWKSDYTYVPEKIHWDNLTHGLGDVTILQSQSRKSGDVFPAYDHLSGVLNYAGQAYVTASTPNDLIDAAYSIIDNLEQEIEKITCMEASNESI